jgi:hypothetical protein
MNLHKRGKEAYNKEIPSRRGRRIVQRRGSAAERKKGQRCGRLIRYNEKKRKCYQN